MVQQSSSQKAMIVAVSRILLSSMLMIAGFLHFIVPEYFNPAIFLPWKKTVNMFAGILEIVLAAALWHPVYYRFASILCTCWFAFLLSVHIYVSYYSIEIFGISDPLLLWGRTLFQFPLIAWAWSMKKYPPRFFKFS